MHSFWWLLGVLHHVIWVATMLLTVQAMPPPPPIRCEASTGCNLSNSYGIWGDRKDCHVPSAAHPQTEEDLRLAVAFASKNKVKIKVVSKFSHTIPKLACPDMSFGDAMLISTANVNSTIEIDAANLAVTVDAGVGLRQLIDKVEEAGLSLVAAPYWEGVSVGGLISTGAHGSSWWGRGGAVHDHVIGLNLVVPANRSEGYAKILRLDSKDEIFKAAKVSLGLLGIISKVKLRLEAAFKRSITYNFTDDAQIEDIYMEHAKKYEFGDITWVSDAYLGQQENSVVVDFNYYRADDAWTPRFNEDVWEEVEQLAFFKHGAKPHWAKNRNAAFLDVQKKYPNFNKFLGVKRLLDPQNILSSEWSDEILFGKAGAKADGCALEGLCICSEDRHCSPVKGYYCQPGLIYKEARVCRYSSSSVESESDKTNLILD
ncbi:hypothetical protein C1H46_044609 [Malus baccata]|uniref:L-gulonolactone oxidase n=1 Tax=Malus baccata TaxID=106549 RepID=A0A540K6K9_MALBA|nr:hypothetical protein C1H46_044609 [Malus baccata]